MIVSPKPDALIKRSQARVALRVPAGTNRLWVRLNDRTITGSLTRSGSLRVATLSRHSGLRYGRNSLYVLAKRSGRRGLVESRSFIFARRVQGLARLKMNPGPVTKVNIRVAAPRLTPAVFHSRREFKRRLSVIRRPRRVRIRLNGRAVTKAFSRPQPTRWKTRLSASARAAPRRQPAAGSDSGTGNRSLRGPATPVRGAPRRSPPGGGTGPRQAIRPPPNAPRRTLLAERRRRRQAAQLPVEDPVEASRLGPQVAPCQVGAPALQHGPPWSLPGRPAGHGPDRPARRARGPSTWSTW